MLARVCAADYSISMQLATQAWGALVIIFWASTLSGLLFAAFAICECTGALEDMYLEEVHTILMNMALAEPGEGVDPQLASCVRQCELAMDIMKQHGWKIDGCEASGDSPHLTEPHYLLQICRHIRSEQSSRSTALEVFTWSFFIRVAKMLRHFSFHRCLRFRLRIPPTAELAGTSTDVEGTSVVEWVQRMVRRMDKEAAAKHKSSNKALKREVRQLHALVHGQEALVRSLAKQQGGVLSPKYTSSGGSRGTPPQRAQFTLLSARQNSLTRTTDSKSNSTVSDHGFGAMTPHSANSSTPEPSAFGHMHRPRIHSNSSTPEPRPQRLGGRDAADLATFTQVAQQLTQVLEQQQRQLLGTASDTNAASNAPALMISSNDGLLTLADTRSSTSAQPL